MEKELYASHPRMFRNNPFKFILNYLVMLVCIVGIIVIAASDKPHVLFWLLGGALIVVFVIVGSMQIIWWLQILSTTLTVTDKRTILRKGILSKFTNEVLHENIRNIQVFQSFMQRMLKVGSIGISSAGQAGVEIEVQGIPTPYDLKACIDQYRINENPLTTD
jgi:uncharacterized membrane protein YdbT with pleckstrin-like domain